MNAMNVISPYKHNGLWVFDDAEKGLHREPFVAGADSIIDVAVKDLPKAENGFNLVFSAHAFPGYHLRFDRGEAEADGYWYESRDLRMKGWLCPALFKYFDQAPQHIYAQFKAK